MMLAQSAIGNRQSKIAFGRAQRGQTLIIALIIMTVLLLLGFVFLGIINRNIIQSSTSRARSIAADLSEAGIRYAQSQLVSGTAGAAWTPDLTPPADFDPNNPLATQQADGTLGTRDPDIFYIRPPSVNAQGASAQLK